MRPGGSLTISPVLTINKQRNVKGNALYNQYKKYTDTGISYLSSDTSLATVSKSGKIVINKKALGESDTSKQVQVTASDTSGSYKSVYTITIVK